MQEFTIRDIENLTGIKAHTIRIWEQRYNMFRPKRKESLHRIYSNEDLKQLLRVAFLYHHGWKISRIASLDPALIEEEVRKATAEIKDHELLVNQLLEAALDFNEQQFQDRLNYITSLAGFESAVKEVFYPYLSKLGHLWSTNNVIPAQEHFSSYIIQNRIIAETEKLPFKNNPPEVVLLCPKGEFHELPLLFINYLMKKNGWATLYRGVNVKLEELEEVMHLPSIRMIYLHLITNFTGFEVDEYLEKISTGFRDKSIIASGNGFRFSQRNFVNVSLLKTDDAIEQFIRNKSI